MDYNVVYGDLIGTPSVVTLGNAKMNSNIDTSFTDDDALLNILLDAAIEEAEHYIESPIKNRDVTIQLSEWPLTFEVPVYPFANISTITYKDSAGATQTVDASDYVLYEIDRRHKIKFNLDTEPALNEDDFFPITITGQAGYTTADMPDQIKNAVLLRFSHRERFREDVPTSYNRLFYAALRPFKLWK